MDRQKLSTRVRPSYQEAQAFLHKQVAKEFNINGQRIRQVGTVVEVNGQYQSEENGPVTDGLVFTVKYPPAAGLDLDNVEDDVFWEEFVMLWNNTHVQDGPGTASGPVTPSSGIPEPSGLSHSVDFGFVQPTAPLKKKLRQTTLLDGSLSKGGAGEGRPAAHQHLTQPSSAVTPTKRPRSTLDMQHAVTDTQQAPGAHSQHTKQQKRVKTSQAAPGTPAPPATPARPATREVLEILDGDEDDSLEADDISMAGRLKSIQLRDFMCHANLECKFGRFVTFISGKNGSGKSAIIQGLQAVLGVSARNTGRGDSLKSYIRTGCASAEVKVIIHNTGPDKLPRFGDEICIVKRIAASGSGGYKMGNSLGSVQKVKKEEVYEVLSALNLDAANPITIITQDKSRTLLADSTVDKRKKFDIFMQGTLLGVILDCLKASSRCVAEATERLNKQVKDLETLKVAIAEDQARVQKLRELEDAAAETRLVGDALRWSLYDECVRAANQYRQERQDLEVELEQLTGELQRLQDRRRDKERERDKLIEIVRSWHEAAKAAVDRQEACKAVVKQCNMRLKSADTRVQQVTRERAALASELEGLEARVKEEQGAAAAQRQDAHQAAEAQLLAAERDKAAADAAYRNAQDKLFDVDNKVLEARDNVRQVERQVGAAEKQVQQTRQQRDAFTHAASVPAAKFGGQAAAHLFTQLSQQPAGFSAPPVGPLGCYLKLKDSHVKWTSAVDVVVRGVLNHWLVSRKEDVQVLKRMAERAGMDMARMPICVVNYRVPPHIVPDAELPADRSEYPLVLDALVIEGDQQTQKLIYNYLLDRTKAASTVMVADDDQARNVVYDGCVPAVQSANNGHPPQRPTRSTSQANTTGSHASHSHSTVTAHEGASFRFDAITMRCFHVKAGRTVVSQHKNEGQPLLGKDVSQQLDSLNAQLRAEEAQLQQLKAELTAAQATVRDLEARQTDAARDKSRLQAARHKATAAYDAARAVVDQLGAQGDTLDHGQSQVILAASNLRQLDTDLEQAQVEKQAASQALAEAQHQLAAQSQKLQEVGDLVSRNQRIDELLHVEIPEVVGQIKAKEDRLHKLRVEKDAKLQQLQGAQEEVEAALALPGSLLDERPEVMDKLRQMLRRKLRSKAEARVARAAKARKPSQAQDSQEAGQEEMEQTLEALVHEAMSLAALRARYERMEAEQEAAHTVLMGSLEEVQFELEKKEEKYEKLKARIAGVSASIDMLRQGLVSRRQAYDKCFKATCNKVNYVFKLLLGRRRHRGRIDINDDTQTLSIQVQVKGMDDQQARWETDLKQLSGGERSLVTVALLLSISNVSQSPFHVLDEYDVYMDPVTRLVATETLLAHAFERQAQYILLSPQDVQAVLKAYERLPLRPEMQYRQLPPDFLITQVLQDPRAAQNNRTPRH